MTFQEKASVFYSLSRMLGAGMPISKSLGVLIEQKPAPAVAKWLLDLQRGIADGHGFSEAISRNTNATELEKSLIHAGEHSGRLPQMIAEIAGYYRQMADSQSLVSEGLLYPAVLLHLSIVLPGLPRLLSDESTPSVLSSILLKLTVMWFLLWGLYRLFIHLKGLASKSCAVEKALHRFPYYGKACQHGARARFAKVVEIGLLAALGMPEIFRFAGSASQSASIGKAAETIANSIAQGESLTDSFAQTEAFPRSFLESVAVGEVSGTLDTEMKHIAFLEHEAFVEAHKQASKRLPMMLYGISAACAALQILLQYLAHFSLYRDFL